MADDDILNFAEILDTLSRFLEAAVHTILYVRQVYPADLFERRKLFNVPVWRSRHPSLSSYVGQVIDAIIEQLSKGKVDKAVLAIKEATTDNVLEHHVFDFAWLGGATAAHYATEGDKKRRPIEGPTFKQIELMLRAFLLKLSSLDSQLSTLPEELTFVIFIEAPPDGPPPTEPDVESGDVPPWVPEQSKKGDEANKHVPVRGATLGVLQLYVEETEAKVELERKKLARRDEKGKGRALN